MTLLLGPRAGQVALDIDEPDPVSEDTPIRRHVPPERPLAAAAP